MMPSLLHIQLPTHELHYISILLRTKQIQNYSISKFLNKARVREIGSPTKYLKRTFYKKNGQKAGFSILIPERGNQNIKKRGCAKLITVISQLGHYSSVYVCVCV